MIIAAMNTILLIAYQLTTGFTLPKRPLVKIRCVKVSSSAQVNYDDLLIERETKLRKKLCECYRFHDADEEGQDNPPQGIRNGKLSEDLNAFFDPIVYVKGMKVGNRQTFDTLITKKLCCLPSI